MANLSRPDVAEWAQLSLSQLEYLGKADIVAPDVGDQRKRFSLNEARLAVIAGCALTNGLTPRALAGPIGWLREHIAWPAVDLPDSPTEIAIELEAERYRALSDFPLDSRVEILAARIFASSLGNDAFSLSHDAFAANLASAKTSDSRVDVERAAAAEKRAGQLLAQHIKWPAGTFNKVRDALDFEVACRGKSDLFFHVSAGTDSWKTFLSKDLSRIEGESAWLVIDVRRLFSERKLMI